MKQEVQGREISALFNPRLSVLVTSCDQEGTPNVLTVAWHVPLSHRPPLVGISIGSTRYSYQLISRTNEFVVNIMPETMKKEVKLCGKYTGRLDDKIEIAGLDTAQAHSVTPPLIVGAVGTVECKVREQVATGDHTLFIGQVLHAEVEQEAFTNQWIPGTGNNVLLCLQRDSYGTFQGEGSKGAPNDC